MALSNLAGHVGGESCELPFEPGTDVKESFHSSQTGGAASELLRGFNLFALALCRDIANIFVVGFLSKPGALSASSAFIYLISRMAGNLHLEDMVSLRITFHLEPAEI